MQRAGWVRQTVGRIVLGLALVVGPSLVVGPLLVFAVEDQKATVADSEDTGASQQRHVVLLTVADAIGPATADYIARAMAQAVQQNPELIILQIDTPGGLDTAMRDIIQLITSSTVPVATYVAPTGARAASAGTYIIYASHIAAMAPGTNLGAATPVQIGGISLPGMDRDKDKNAVEKTAEKNQKDGGEGDVPLAQGDAMSRKIINDASAYIRGLAELHGRNVEWAEKAVREAVSLQAREALALNVIDVVASDISDLLTQIDGREVSVLARKRTLHTAGSSVVEILPDWRSQFLSVITNPNVAYILMLVGIYGLILEFYNPGGLVPGTVGAICLLLALYAFQMLPVNYAGVGLILLGVGLMVAEALQPSFGMLGFGGITALVIGSIILIDTRLPGFKIYLSVIAAVALASAFILTAVVGLALKARGRPVVSGVEEMPGKTGRAVVNFADGKGRVFVHSEIWQAHSTEPIAKDQPIRVVAVQGLTLDVAPQARTDATASTSQVHN